MIEHQFLIKKKSNRKIKLLSKNLRIIVAIQEANYN
jgi:hypothetical protein